MNVCVVKYNAGNTQSVANALRRLDVEATLTDSAEELHRADKVIFPGVGEASSAMRYLREKNLAAAIKNLRQPVLGICLGMQLLGASSEENETECLGVVPFRVRRFAADNLKVPQTGWNDVFDLKSPLFSGVAENSFVYFVHSYFMETGAETTATANYGQNFSAAIRKDNFYGVQFHAEKSGAIGASVLRNFLSLR